MGNVAPLKSRVNIRRLLFVLLAGLVVSLADMAYLQIFGTETFSQVFIQTLIFVVSVYIGLIFASLL